MGKKIYTTVFTFSWIIQLLFYERAEPMNISEEAARLWIIEILLEI